MGWRLKEDKSEANPDSYLSEADSFDKGQLCPTLMA